MNKFFREYVDLTAMIIAFIIPLVLIIVVKRKTGRQTRAVPSYFLMFGPSAILTFIFFHLFENSYHAIENSLAGRFKYDFHFYALILMGVVMATIASFFIRACWQKCNGHPSCDRLIFLYMLFVVTMCLPLLPISPISNVPVFCCLISLAGLFFVRRKIKGTEKDRFPYSTTV